MKVLATLRIEDDGTISVEQEVGLSEVRIKADEDATVVEVGKVRVAVSRTQASMFFDDKLLHRAEL